MHEGQVIPLMPSSKLQKGVLPFIMKEPCGGGGEEEAVFIPEIHRLRCQELLLGLRDVFTVKVQISLGEIIYS